MVRSSGGGQITSAAFLCLFHTLGFEFQGKNVRLRIQGSW